MPSFFDLQIYAATGIASPDMTAFDKMRALAAFGGGKTQTLTGITPLSFKSDGSPLISWSMLGNGSQTGTPSPDNIIMPELVGVRTANLIDVQDKSNVGWALSDAEILTQLNNLPSGSYIFSAEFILTARNDVSDESNRGLTFVNSSGTLQYMLSWGSAEVGTIVKAEYAFTITPSRVGKFTAAYFYGCGNNNTGRTGFATIKNIRIDTGWQIPITCAGQTVPVYLGQTQTVRRVRKLVLTGEETFSNYSSNYPHHFIYTGSKITGRLSGVAPICTHYIGSTASNYSGLRNLYISVSTSGSVRLTIHDDDYTLDNWNTYLAAQYAAGHPVTVWFVLETEQTGTTNEPLAKIGDYADELHSTDAAVTIPTVKGQNTLTVETELQPSKMTIKYR